VVGVVGVIQQVLVPDQVVLVELEEQEQAQVVQ
jgi:hypothetical protein